MKDELTIEQAATWLADFERQKGRPLRVLHIGNIANNAYNNARIQRQRGIEAYVMSFDYYHIMATPEWEDADFVGDVGDPFMPDWSAVDLNGFERPRWFVAGPIDLCIRYLLAEIGSRPAARKLWWVLNAERWLLSRQTRTAQFVRRFMRHVLPPIMFNGFINKFIINADVPGYSVIATAFEELLRRLAKFRDTKTTLRQLALIRKLNRNIAYSRPYEISSRRALLKKRLQPTLNTINADIKAHGGKTMMDEAFLSTRMCYWTHPFLAHLFHQFDVVQCYATYTAIPLMMGRHGPKGYVAYEHGTIRGLPFEDNDEGKLCAASYRAAAKVCITNTDNLSAAEKLRLNFENVIALPHAFDDKKLMAFAQAHAAEAVLLRVDKTVTKQPRVTFFTPARQDWTNPNPGLVKNNDRIFHALKILKDEGLRPLLRAVEWGSDVAASKELIRELGIEDMVEWVQPMKKKALWQAYLENHAVVDQFSSPALGGVSFETMVLGRRLISHLDRAMNRRFFGQEPPILYAETAEDIAAAMRRVMLDPDDIAGDGQAAQSWMQVYHSADRITTLQVAAYAAITTNNDGLNAMTGTKR